MATSALAGSVRDASGSALLIAQRCALAEAEEYGDFITSPLGHYDLWEC